MGQELLKGGVAVQAFQGGKAVGNPVERHEVEGVREGDGALQVEVEFDLPV
jgi:hypothetical protein